MRRSDSNSLQKRDDCNEVFRLHQGSDLAFVFAPSSDQRRALREVWNSFPKPFEDCYAALEWVRLHANPRGYDVSKIATAGDSAGGCRLCLRKKSL